MQTLDIIMMVVLFVVSLGCCSFNAFRNAAVLYIKVVAVCNQWTSFLRLSLLTAEPTPATASRILLTSLVPTIPLVLVIQQLRGVPLLRPFEFDAAFLEFAAIAMMVEFISLAIVTHNQLPAKPGRAALISLVFTPLGTVLSCITLIVSILMAMFLGIVVGAIVAIYQGRDLSVP
ncbi:hypothetical protein CA54_19000 [Symmachiella macrocystis]|uniref:Uncharacterized protein n=1 Tax=Symmachiella macrocystis TaxID=2527985 RepID=A0A5C6BQZ3_9PLAN|nr:hypothetical protein [Symmachiella macrocystis]TWU13074.1 hypothetical protein CA54_19000 [Symmachiella macrocystis]